MRRDNPEYEQFIRSDLWKAIRQIKLDEANSTCQRCGDPANHVHHKTYERFGGKERLDDLEALCADCHEIHHRVDRFANNRKKQQRALSARAVINYLTPKQKQKLTKQFGNLSLRISDFSEQGYEFRNQCMALLGLDKIFGIPKLQADGCTVTCSQMRNGKHWVSGRISATKGRRDPRNFTCSPEKFLRHEAAAFVQRTATKGHTKKRLEKLGVPWPPPPNWITRYKNALTRFYHLRPAEIQNADPQNWFPSKLGGIPPQPTPEPIDTIDTDAAWMRWEAQS